jgi:hypothetical protein
MKYLFFLRYFLLYPIQTIDDIITLHNTLKNYLDMIDYLYNKENSSPLEIPQIIPGKKIDQNSKAHHIK